MCCHNPATVYVMWIKKMHSANFQVCTFEPLSAPQYILSKQFPHWLPLIWLPQREFGAY